MGARNHFFFYSFKEERGEKSAEKSGRKKDSQYRPRGRSFHSRRGFAVISERFRSRFEQREGTSTGRPLVGSPLVRSVGRVPRTVPVATRVLLGVLMTRVQFTSPY